MDLITGRTGTDHVLARHDALINQTLFGDGDFVLNTGYHGDSVLEGRVTDAIHVTIYPGYLIMQGRLCEHLIAEAIAVAPCSVETLKKKAYILVTYTIDGQGIENVSFEVVEGEPSSNGYLEPTVPYADGIIDDGDTHQMILYAVYINGFSIDHIDAMFTVNSTTPIQTALDYARSNMSIIEGMFNDLIESISQGVKGQWKKSVTVTSAASAITVSMSTSYSYSSSDIVDIYLNGLKIGGDMYSVTGEDNVLSVTLLYTTFVGEMEVVATRMVSE